MGIVSITIWGSNELAYRLDFCLFDLLLYVHGKQLRSFTYNDTVPGQGPHRGSLPVFCAHSFIMQ